MAFCATPDLFYECIKHVLIVTKANTYILFIAINSAFRMKIQIYLGPQAVTGKGKHSISHTTFTPVGAAADCLIKAACFPSYGLRPSSLASSMSKKTCNAVTDQSCSSPSTAAFYLAPKAFPELQPHSQGLKQRLQQQPPLQLPEPTFLAGFPVGREIFQGCSATHRTSISTDLLKFTYLLPNFLRILTFSSKPMPCN